MVDNDRHAPQGLRFLAPLLRGGFPALVEIVGARAIGVRVARVDLSSGSVSYEPIPEDWARKYIGARGLGVRYVLEAGPSVDPLGPDNLLCFMNGPLTGIDDEAFDKIVANNVKSVLWLAQLTLPWMAAGGSFILVGSIGGLLANTVIGAYGMSKAMGHHLVRNLAAEWGPKNIRVNAIAPGLVKTEFARALWEDETRRAERIAVTPLRRIGDPRDIGGIAVFLASDAAAFITGQVIVADGGVTIL